MAQWTKWNPPDLNVLTATYGWGGSPEVDYALDVYFGDDDRPARPWVEYVVEAEDTQALLDISVVPNDYEQTFVNFAFLLGDKFREAMESDIWYWPRETIRSDGSVASSPRDIVDTRALVDSQAIDFGF